MSKKDKNTVNLTIKGEGGQVVHTFQRNAAGSPKNGQKVRNTLKMYILLQQGFQLLEVRDILGISTRTAYRYLQEIKAVENDPVITA